MDGLHFFPPVYEIPLRIYVRQNAKAWLMFDV